MIWRQLREHQIRKMTNYGYENKGFLDSAVTFYAHMLYNLGVLAARIQGFAYEIRNNKTFVSGHSDLVKPLLAIVNEPQIIIKYFYLTNRSIKWLMFYLVIALFA